MKKILTLLCLSALLCACHDKKEDTPVPEPEPETIMRTVIVYMSGENNLSADLSDDLAEMTEGSRQLGKGEKLVAFVDDTSSFGPYIVELKNGERDTVRHYAEDFYASDPEQFREVITWIEQQYPAKGNDFALVLWGHATGWLQVNDTISQVSASRPRHAYGQDNGTNMSYSLGSKWMNITQMKKALSGLPTFTYILADCCCMMSLEAAYELRSTAHYLIGSPAEIPGRGAPYQQLTKHLFSTSATLYKDIVDAYFDYYADYANLTSSEKSEWPYMQGNSVPLSAIDLTKMEAVAQAIRPLLKAPTDYDLDHTAYYFYLDLPAMYDIGGIIAHNHDAADATTQAALRALTQAVVYSRYSQKWMTMYNSLRNAFDQFDFTASNFVGASMHIPQPRYNYSRYNSYKAYNTGLKELEWYNAVAWSRFE